MRECLGDLLVESSAGAREVVLVAPFVKASTFERLLTALPSSAGVKLFTRWAPEEIAAGVSDLAVWDLVRDRCGAHVWLVPQLHAKYYRFDRVVYVGSANLTAAALGWCTAPNLELLLQVDPVAVEGFESRLFARALLVDEDIYEATRAAVFALTAGAPPPPTYEDALAASPWFPVSPHPQHLYDCYRGRREFVLDSVFEDGQRDLVALRLPPGLSRAAFDAVVAARLRDLAALAAVDVAAADGVTRQLGSDILREHGVPDHPAGDPYANWDTLRAWLLRFFGRRYREKPTLVGPCLERSSVIR